MTYFGKNIKKIRSIQKLSQANFAEIFGLSRASIGAYEEGRAEAKLDLIIQIAKYFSITVDDLINKEITVNQLYHFNIFDEKFTNKINIGSEVLNTLEFSKTPVVICQDLLINEVETLIKESANYISLPHQGKDNLAILVSRDAFKYLPVEISNNDIIIVYTNFTLERGTSLADKFWLIKSQKLLYFGEVKSLDKKTLLFFPPDSSPIAISISEIDFILPLETLITKSPSLNQDEPGRIKKLELQVNDLYNRL